MCPPPRGHPASGTRRSPAVRPSGRARIHRGGGAWGGGTPVEGPFLGARQPLGDFLTPPQGHARCPWGHLGDIVAPFSPQRFQEVEEAHLRHMKGLIGSYSHSVEDTHVQIGQVRPPAPCGVSPPLFCHPMSPPRPVPPPLVPRCMRSSSRTWRTSAPRCCCGGSPRARARGESDQVSSWQQPGGVPTSYDSAEPPPSLTAPPRCCCDPPFLLAGVLDFDEYRLAPAQEGKYVCPLLSPTPGGWLVWGGGGWW